MEHIDLISAVGWSWMDQAESQPTHRQMIHTKTQTVYDCWIVSMSRFFIFITDSTWPFSVCSSLSLQQDWKKWMLLTSPTPQGSSMHEKWFYTTTCIPCHFCSSLRLLSNLVEFGVVIAITKLRLRRMQPVEGPLRLRPLEFAIFLTEILLPCKGDLRKLRLEISLLESG